MNIRRSHPLSGFLNLVLFSLSHRKFLAAAGLLCALAAALLSLRSGGGAPAASQESGDGSVSGYEETSAAYKKALAGIDLGIRSYQTALAEEEEYLEQSSVMQLKPHHVYNVSTVYELRALAGARPAVELEAQCTAFLLAIRDTAFLKDLADSAGTEPRFLNELISAELFSASVIAEKESSGTGRTSAPSLPPGGTACRFTVKTAGDSFASAGALSDAVKAYLLTLPESSAAWFACSLTAVSSSKSETIDQQLRSGQKATSDRILDYSDKLVKIGTSRTGFVTKYKPSSPAEEISSGGKISVRRIGMAFIAGVLGAQILLMLLYCAGGSVASEAEFRRRYPVRLIAPFSVRTSREEAETEILAALLRGRRSVIFTGTADDDDVRIHAETVLSGLAGTETELRFAPDFICSPETRRLLPSADAAVLIEKRNRSLYRDIEKELRVLDDLGVEILGAILL